MPEERAELISQLSRTGLSRIEAASFVHPERVPTMAHAEEVIALIERSAAIRYSGLVLNQRGFDRLKLTNLEEVRIAVSCTESFSQRNAGMSQEDALAIAAAVVSAGRSAGLKTSVTLAVAFGCPFEGAVNEGKVLADIEKIQAMNADELVLADTIGVATPTQVRRLVQGASALGVTVGLHLHDTRNTAIANALEGVQHGVTMFDASIGGLGGCPFAPGATGNVATEDLAYVLEREGFDTGLDVEKLISVAHWIGGVLNHPLSGHLQFAGLAKV